MVLHTIISPADIFYDFSKNMENIKKNVGAKARRTQYC